jgi:hypothetical protein
VTIPAVATLLLAGALQAVALQPAIVQATAAPTATAKIPDVHSLIAVARQRIETADLRASGHLVRVDASGTRTSYGYSLKAHWFPGVLRVFVDVSPPSGAGPAARSHILLEMRPNGQNSIQIAHPGDKAPATLAFDKWTDGPLGAGFSYEDFFEQQYFWPGQTVVEEIKFGARDCDLLKSTPGPDDRTHYTEIKTWLDHSIAFPVYLEKTLRGIGAVKEFTYFGLRHDGGVWSATQVEVKTRGQAGTTLLIVDRGSTKASLNLGDFSPEQLIRF